MNELQRAEYLDFLGIESFVPRISLPNSKPSRLCEIPEEPLQDPVVEPTAMFESLEAKNSSSASNKALISKVVDSLTHEWPQKEIRAEAQKQTVVSKEEPDEKEEALSFVLMIWRPSDDLLVIDSHRKGAALPTERLLGNLLKYSRWNVTSLPRADVQNWPVVDSVKANQGWSAAKEMMESFLDGRLVTKPVKEFLLLGEDAYRAANGEEVGREKSFAEVLFTEMPISTLGVKAVVIPSLAEILESPADKAKIWPLIQ